ncbi:MAG TPA: transposase [Pseudomonadaceae bacterium]|nr:transposase [Pseudomonadaceae bacterium]
MEGLQGIFRRYFPSYRQRHQMCVRELHAAESIMQCRTAALGGHVESCPEGHTLRVHYNSCKHRSCTRCNGLPQERWLQARKGMLLDCPHYHLVFTVPHEFVPLWQYNRAAFMNLLFQGVQQALTTLLDDPRHLGARPGMLMSFHSWGRNLSLHPHIHCLVTDGGLDAGGEWRRPRRSHFLPAKVLMLVFRGIMSQRLDRALEQGGLVLPAGTDRFQWHRCIKKCRAKAWNVSLRERYDHGRGVMTYLARYVRGGPIHDRQVSIEIDRIRLRYFSHQRQRKESLLFSGDGFIAQFLQHVPEKGSQVVRGYGLYANGKHEALNRARQCHGQETVSKPRFLDWQSWIGQLEGRDYRRCETCRRPLRIIHVMPRQQSPPRVGGISARREQCRA